MKNGRPTLYNDEIADRICDLVSTHSMGIAKIIEMYPDLPKDSTIKEWRLKHASFAAKYLEAKSLQAQILVEEIDDLIPTEIGHYFDERGNKRVDGASASLLIAKINNRKWTAARLAPRIYSEKNQTESTVTIKHEDLLKQLK